MGIICPPTSGVEQQHTFDEPIIDSRIIPGSETDGALKAILMVRAMPCTLKCLLEDYPGFKATKAPESELSNDLIAEEITSLLLQ